jgi:hypothetical protein
MRYDVPLADAGGMHQRPVTRPRPLPSRQFWVGLLLGVSVVSTALTGLVVGWFAVYFQLFGESADADDYRMAAGGYGAAALLLCAGALAVRTWRAPTWELIWAVAGAAVLALLAMDALSEATRAEPGAGYSGWIDGAGGVAACPWTWPLVVLGIWGPLQGRARIQSPTGAE